MAPPKFWHKLGKKFRKLDPDGRLGLVWSCRPGGRYNFAFRYNKSDERIQAEFDVLAIRGGREIDKSDPGYTWLLQIVKMNPNDMPGTVLQFEPGTHIQSIHNTGAVNRLREACEILCHRMESRALEREGKNTVAPERTEGAPSAPRTPAKPTTGSVKPPKPGPETDYQTASRVADTVKKVAPEGNWRRSLDAICDELDENKVPMPKTWKKRGHTDWSDCLAGERQLVEKAVSHHLKNAAQR